MENVKKYIARTFLMSLKNFLRMRITKQKNDLLYTSIYNELVDQTLREPGCSHKSV